MQFYHRKAFLLALLLSSFAWFLFTAFDYLFFHQEQVSFWSLLASDIPCHELLIRFTTVGLFFSFGLIISFYMNRLEHSETRLNNIFNNVIPICITDNGYRIISANESYRHIFGPTEDSSGFIMCHDSRPGPKCKTEECPLYQISHLGKDIYTCESTKVEGDKKRHFIVTATALFDPQGNQVGIIETFQDITARRLLEGEKEKLIGQLSSALEKVKLLSGFLPICASCKKIRDDKGYWTQIETYIKNHSEAEFSHGICPECAEKLYGEYAKRKNNTP